MTHRLLAAAALCLIGAGTALAQPASPKTTLFVQDAALGNQFEIAEAKIVLEDSTDASIRAIAAEMLRDHEIAAAALDRDARASGAPTSFVFGAGLQKRVDDLGLMDSPKLDQAYLDDQASAHARAVASLADYAAAGDDPSLRAYARTTLPTVLAHQRMIASMVGGTAAF